MQTLELDLGYTSERKCLKRCRGQQASLLVNKRLGLFHTSSGIAYFYAVFLIFLGLKGEEYGYYKE